MFVLIPRASCLSSCATEEDLDDQVHRPSPESMGETLAFQLARPVSVIFLTTSPGMPCIRRTVAGLAVALLHAADRHRPIGYVSFEKAVKRNHVASESEPDAHKARTLLFSLPSASGGW